MRYGAVLSDSWKALWRARALWGFLALYLAATGMIVLVVGGAIAALFAVALEGTAPDVGMTALLSVLAGVAGLAMIPVFWFFHGGAIHLANEALEGRKVWFSDGIVGGRRHFGALAGFETLYYGITLGILVVVGLVFALVFGAIIAGSANLGEGAMFGALLTAVLCMYAVIFVLGTAVSVVLQAFEAIGARAAVLSGRSGREAFTDAWAAVRGSFKAVVVMGLIVIGVTWAYSTVMSFVLVPLQFLFYPQMMSVNETTDPAQFFALFGTFYVVYGVATLVLTFPLSVYLYIAWTAFYRQLVGIAPAAEPVAPAAYGGHIPAPPVPQPAPGAIPAPPGQPGIPAPPAPPAPPTAPTPPSAPDSPLQG